MVIRATTGLRGGAQPASPDVNPDGCSYGFPCLRFPSRPGVMGSLVHWAYGPAVFITASHFLFFLDLFFDGTGLFFSADTMNNKTQDGKASPRPVLLEPTVLKKRISRNRSDRKPAQTRPGPETWFGTRFWLKKGPFLGSRKPPKNRDFGPKSGGAPIDH